jgi:hypothetical protein
MRTSAPNAFYVAAAVSTSLRRPTSFAPPTRLHERRDRFQAVQFLGHASDAIAHRATERHVVVREDSGAPLDVATRPAWYAAIPLRSRREVLALSKRKPRRAGSKRVARPGAEIRLVARGLEPLAILPGALMYRRPYPPGIPDPHSARSAHLHAAAAAPAFASIPGDERAALFESLGRSHRRSEYHWLRFLDLLKELPARRDEMPGHVFWDEFVEFVYFEAQAFCGAARAVLDEVVYLIARVHGVPPKKARKDPWETSNLVTAQSLATPCQVPEVSVLRASASWFGRLNAYRNSFFHHGWRHGTGHFDAGGSRAAAVDPAANALLIPDFESLAGRAKPHEWTYHRSDMLDQSMKDLHEGLDALLRGLCEGRGPPPSPRPGRSHGPSIQT